MYIGSAFLDGDSIIFEVFYDAEPPDAFKDLEQGVQGIAASEKRIGR